MIVMGQFRDYILHNEKSIKGFFGEYRWLSNFHLYNIEYENIIYPSTEHAYQAAKSLDPNIREEFINLSCEKARLKGQIIDIRPDWQDIKYSVMYDVILYKFETNKDLKSKLIETGDKYLEETNHWNDTYYGVCDGVGENNLGKILMEIRSKLKYL